MNSISFSLNGNENIALCDLLKLVSLCNSGGQAKMMIADGQVLRKTETEILKDIALGLTTKDIAEKRFSSFHTINTHRKNIFRKLSVNNVHEATRYALRAGIVDEAEYYI